ncbi:hypothetical protein FRB95_007463 [Tulasnella sp. JGI-2019a]|nr:hypothetical protein FRB95_007463 [Tulasnella sp. JGI-2019a]
MPKSPVSKASRVSSSTRSVNLKHNNKGYSKKPSDHSARSRALSSLRCDHVVFEIAYPLFTTSEKYKPFALNALLVPIAVACSLQAYQPGPQALVAFNVFKTHARVYNKTPGTAHQKPTTKIDKQTEADSTFEASTTFHDPREPIEVLYVQ